MIQKFHNNLTGVALLFNIKCIPKLTKIYRQIYFTRCKSRGKADSIAFLKALLVCAERYALHQPIDPVPWTKSDNDGFPKVIKAFKPHLRSSNRFEVIFTLSVFRTVELLRLPISRDISSVTDPPVYSEEAVRKIVDFIPKIKWLKPVKLRRLKYHLTYKNGPNGPALKSSDSDVSGLFMDPKLFGAIQIIQEKLGSNYPLDKNFKASQSPGILSKLTQFPEKAGKTRTIAVIDYYSQKCLKSLHRALMSLLSSLRTDGTYSHRNVGTWAQSKTMTKSYTYCADLSSATDRFPAEIQRALLFKLIPDHDLAAAMWTLLAERTFTVAWSGEQVRYETGQPMGAYASWPLFALAHHVVAEYCARSDPRDMYRLIGDDFMSSSEIQSQHYRSMMSALGVEINKSKTVESLNGSTRVSAEIAKQLYLDGVNLSPLTPGFIRDLMKPHMFNMCLAELRERYDPIPVTPSMLIQTLFKRGSERVWLLSSNPWNGSIKPSDEGYDTKSPWASRDTECAPSLMRNAVVMTMTMKAEVMFSELLDSEEYGFGEVHGEDSLQRSDAELHVEEQLRADLSDVMLKLNDFEAEAFEPSVLDADSLQFLVDPRDQYKSRKEQRRIVESYLIESLLWELPTISEPKV